MCNGYWRQTVSLRIWVTATSPSWFRILVYRDVTSIVTKKIISVKFEIFNLFDELTVPPLPIKTYTTLVPTFVKKGVIFQRYARIREIKKKGQFFRHTLGKFWKRVNILHASVCFHPGFHTLDQGRVFKYSIQIRHHEKNDVRRKNVWYIKSRFHKKGILSYINIMKIK